MDNNFMRCMKWILEAEGGYVNDPEDPGGETKYGISKRAFPNIDIANLTVDTACQLYYDRYWLPSTANTCDWPLDLCTFDSAVLDGVEVAKRFLAQTKNYKVVIELRWARYNNLVKKNQKLQKFINGWRFRLNNLKKFIDQENINDSKVALEQTNS